MPQGSGVPSTTQYSYEAQSNNVMYLEDQSTQGATIKRLEMAYSSLAESHRGLRDSHKKMKKRKNKRDKFFTKIWKGVRGLWKVLKPRDSLDTSKDDINDEALTK